MDTKKQLILVLLFALAPVLKIYSESMNLDGDTIVVNSEYYLYSATGTVLENEKVFWCVTNGMVGDPVGVKASENDDNCFVRGRNIFIKWNDVAEKGKLEYTVSGSQKNGYADIEILSVANSQIDSITVGNFKISQDIIYIPKGKSGSVWCYAYMIYPACKGGSNTRVTDFRWQLPPSLGGNTIQDGSEIRINYDAYSGDGEKIIITPFGYGKDGLPRSFTIKRMDSIVENRDISTNESFEGEDLIFRNVNIFSGANVTAHGTNSVRLLPQFHAYYGSNVHISAGNNLMMVNDAKLSSGETAGAGLILNGEETGFSQNYPNPCRDNTNVDYYLPENTGKAVLNVVSSTGNIVRSIDLNERGAQVFNLDISGLSPGIYLYYIVADGQMSGSRRMIVSSR